MNDAFAEAGGNESGAAGDTASNSVGQAPSGGLRKRRIGRQGTRHGRRCGFRSTVTGVMMSRTPVPTTASESLQARLAIAEDQAAAHWDRLLRLQADVENQRKRAQRELGQCT